MTVLEDAFSFKIQARQGRARAGVFRTPHGNLATPVFAPVGTQASVKALTPAQLDELVAMLVKEYKTCATENTRPYPHIVETLEKIHGMNMPMGVCTNKPETLTRQILEGLGLAKYFSSVVGGDTTSTRKPDPQPVLACLRGLVSEPASSLMIGDSVHDVHAAHAAGVTVGVVPWGYRSAPVEELGADFVLHNIAALPGMIREAGAQLQQNAH